MAGLKQNYTYFVAITFNDRTVNRRNRRGKKTPVGGSANKRLGWTKNGPWLKGPNQ